MKTIVANALKRFADTKQHRYMVPICLMNPKPMPVCYDYMRCISPVLEINVDEELDWFSFIAIMQDSTSTETAKVNVNSLFLEVNSHVETIPFKVIRFLVEKNLLPYNDILEPIPDWIIFNDLGIACYGKIDVVVTVNIFMVPINTNNAPDIIKTCRFEIHTAETIADLVLTVKSSSEHFESCKIVRLYNLTRDFQPEEKLYKIITCERLQTISCDICFVEDY